MDPTRKESTCAFFRFSSYNLVVVKVKKKKKEKKIIFQVHFSLDLTKNKKGRTRRNNGPLHIHHIFTGTSFCVCLFLKSNNKPNCSYLYQDARNCTGNNIEKEIKQLSWKESSKMKLLAALNHKT